MKILSLNQTEYRQSDIVFRNSILRQAVALASMLVMVGLAGYLLVYRRIGDFELSKIAAGGIGLAFLLFARICFGAVRATLRPTNWVMRVRADEVLLKYRHYMNWRMNDDDPQVIVLSASEIASVRSNARWKETQRPNHHTEMSKSVYLEIILKDSDTTALQKSLDEEAARPGWKTWLGTTRCSDCSLQVAAKGAIRIAWGGNAATVRPGIRLAIEALARFARVEETRQGVDDFTSFELAKLGKDEQRKRLAELARTDHLSAVETARRLYGCSLSEADTIVQGLIPDTEA